MFKSIVDWVRSLLFPRKHDFVFVFEFPKKIKRNKVYVEGNIAIQDYWYAKLFCPCGCGDELTLNLIDDVSPCWELFEVKRGLISLTPSIRRLSNCKSHFWIRESKVIWCKD